MPPPRRTTSAPSGLAKGLAALALCWLERGIWGFCRIGLLGLFVLHALSAPAALARSAPTLLDNMDGQQPVLRLSGEIRGVRLLRQELIDSNHRYGTGSELVVLNCPGGQSARLAYPVPPAPIINELKLTAWVQCNRPGVQLAARVVLPRSPNKTTGQPHQLLVRGSESAAAADWQQLVLTDLPTALQRQARIARAHYGSVIDERGAYLAELVLLAPGGPGSTQLLTDQIAIHGLIPMPRPDAAAAGTQPPSPSSLRPTDSPRLNPLPAPQPAGGGIAMGVRAGVPRVIQWQGEPFELLKQIGFNTVGMSRLPTEVELSELRAAGLTVLCPPPVASQLSEQRLGNELAEVMAWDLGEQLSSTDLDQAASWQQLVRRYDPIDARPTLISSSRDVLQASRLADVILLNRSVLGSSLSIQNYATWLTQQTRLARPGTPIWSRVETQLSPLRSVQIAALGSRSLTTHGASYRQLWNLISATFGVGSRGFYFASHTSLAGEDVEARRRRMALELINLRLRVVQPWLAAGKPLTSARSTDSQLTALVMQVERSHLMVPIWWSSNTQPGGLPQHQGPVSLVVPGVPESCEAYLLTPGGAQRLRHKRVTGGIRVSLEKRPTDALVLLTSDPQAFSQTNEYLRKQAPRAARLRSQLAAIRSQQTQSVVASLAAGPTENQAIQNLLSEAASVLQQSQTDLASGRFFSAYQRAAAADSVLDRVDGQLWNETVGPDEIPIQALQSHPLAASFSSLADFRQLKTILARAPAGANLLPGGGFEHLPTLLQLGWKHQRLPQPGVQSAVRLSPEAPHSGSYCLELEALPADPDAPPATLPTAPAWVTSPEMPLQAGDLVEITGVARVPQQPLGSIDGLMIFDSLGGEEMAVRVTEAPSWRPFRLLRAAPTDTTVTVTIALTGHGRVQLDDLAIRVLRRSDPADRMTQEPQSPTMIQR